MAELSGPSRLLGLLSSAPLQAEHWPLFLSALCDATGCTMGVITTDSETERVAPAGGGPRFDPRPLELYNSHFGSLDPLFPPVMRRLRHAVISDEELVPRGDYIKTEFFNEVLAPFGLHYVIVLPCVITPQRREFVTLFTGLRSGALSTEATRMLTALLPHMANALETTHLLRAAAGREHLLNETLEHIQGAAFLLGPTARIIGMNSQGEVLLRECQPLFLRDGQLRASRPREDAALTAAIRSASAAHSPAKRSGQRGTRFLLISRKELRPLRLAVVPMGAGADAYGRRSGEVLCIVSNPASRPAGLDHALTSLYGLTPIQCKVAGLLLEGLDPKDVADRLRMTYDSARFHMKKIYARTGTRKQSDLMVLLATLPGIH